ncbi:MAG: KpsF/GutQ family sugar-phosphate isomerase [Pseudomonadales bacterium]
MSTSFIESATRTIELETAAIADLKHSINENFTLACEIMLACKGRVVVTGMGKSGHIGNKIAATLASTGTPSFYVHPGEASHGDLGMITQQDVVLALSNSGTTGEILTIVPLIRRMNAKLISMTGVPDSTLAQAADVNLNTAVATEACPLNLAPTSSTTATLVMGDALAIALLEARGFTAEDFAFSHPGGALGRRLLLKVEDVMVSGDATPKVGPDTLLSDALLEISTKGMGMTTVVDEHNHLLGIFTDGDLRRALDARHEIDIHNTPIAEVMSRDCKVCSSGMLAAQAMNIMEENSISVLAAVNTEQEVIGAIHLHELIKAGLA